MSPLNIKGITEIKLIEQCLLNDRVSQKQLYELYARKMFSLCKRYARYEAEAEDFMQEGFVSVFRNLHQFKRNGSFEGWIRRIMVNTALKHIKKKSFSHEIPGIEDYKHRSVDPDIFSKLSEDELMNLISDLPDGYRTVFNLFAIEGYSHKEIGIQLEIGESTSRSQLVKARRLLQQKIENLKKIAV